ncbi:hypothetical protein EON64_02015, partial [archaeon]
MIASVVRLHNSNKQTSSSEPSTSATAPDSKAILKNIEEDMELNWEVEDEDTPQLSSTDKGVTVEVKDQVAELDILAEEGEAREPIEERCLLALFECWGLYLQLHPACKTAAANDAAKLLEEAAGLKDYIHLYKHVISLLELGRKHFSWFGSDEENLKMFHNLFMHGDYRVVMKNFVLSPLHEQVQSTSLAEDCMQLVHSVFYANSGLFEGHHVFSYEMHTEVTSYLQAVNASGAESMFILECIIRIAYTWNVQLADDCANFAQGDDPSDVLAPLSPVLYCMLCLLAGHFISFLPLLSSKQRMVLVAFMADVSPEEYDMDGFDNTSIGTAVRTPEQRTLFFKKFETGFGAKLHEVFVQALIRQVHAVRDNAAYTRLLYKIVAGMKYNFESFSSINELVRSLFYSFTPSVNPNPPPKASSIWKHLENRLVNQSDFIGQVSLHIDVILQGRDKKIIKKLLKHNGADAIVNLDSALSLALDNFWMQLGTVYLEKLSSGGTMPEGMVLSWLHSKWLGFGAEITEMGGIARIACMLRQLHLLDELIRGHLPRSSGSIPDLQEVLPVELLALSDYLCTLLIQVLASLQQASDGKQMVVANLLEGSLLKEHLMDNTAFGMLCRKASVLLFPFLVASTKAQGATDNIFALVIANWDAAAAGADMSYKDVLLSLLHSGACKSEQRSALEALSYEIKLADPVAVIQELSVPPVPNTNFVYLNSELVQFTKYINNISPLITCYLSNPLLPPSPILVLSPIAHYDQSAKESKFIFQTHMLTDQTLSVFNGAHLMKVARVLSANLQFTALQVRNLSADHTALWTCLKTPLVSLSDDTPSISKTVEVEDCVSVATQLLESVKHMYENSFVDLLSALLTAVKLLDISAKFFVSCIVIHSLCSEGKRILHSELLLDVFMYLVHRIGKVTSKQVSCALSTLYVKLIFRCMDVSIKSAKRLEQENYLDDAKQVVSCLHRCCTSLSLGELDIEAIKTQLVKWLKTVLRNRYEDHAIYPVVISFYSVLYTRLRYLADDESWYCPRLAMKHMTEHTKFSLIFESSDIVYAVAKVAILKLLLALVRICLSRGFELVIDIQAVLMPLYSPNLLPENRIILRIVELVAWHADPQVDNVRVLVLSRAQQSLQSYLLDFVKPNKVYHTISAFPVQRQLVNNVFSWENSAHDIPHIQTAMQAYYTKITQGDLQGALDYDVPEDRQEAQDSYDPAYYLPIMLHALQMETISIRSWIQSGLASLVFVSMASDCAAMRTVALASLQLLYTQLTSEQAERDASFRDRKQVLQLFDFIRNAIFDEGLDMRQTHLPLALAAFLARSAMVLMQPTHGSYMPICRYLINRQFLDSRDLPLFETSLAESRDLGVWIQMLRNIRDSLKTGADHRTLCRKHVYTRLSLLTTSVGDVKLTMVYLDILERGLCMPDAAAYLLEKTPLLLSLHPFLSTQTNAALYSRGICLVHKALWAAHLLARNRAHRNNSYPHLRETVLHLLGSVRQRLSPNSPSLSLEAQMQVLSLLWDYEVMRGKGRGKGKDWRGLPSLDSVHASVILAMLRGGLSMG